MTVSIWQAEDTQPVREVDVLVVGAGLIGCTTAYFFAQAGRQVTITEMRDVALGASSRNAGFMITGLDTYYHRAIDLYGHAATRELWSISEQTHRHWREFARRDGNVRLTESGSMLLAESPEEARELEQTARAMNADGIDVIYHEGDPLRRGFFAAIEQPWDAAVQPYELVWAILRQSGAELIANNELYSIRQERDTVIVHTRQFRFHARHVMLCTNAYSVNVHPYFVGKVTPTRAQCLVTAPLKERGIFKGCGYSDYGYMYYRETFDGRLLLGGGRKGNKRLEHNTTDDRVTDPVQRHLDWYLKTRFPEVDVPVERRWSGIMGFTPDGIPLVGALPDMPRVGFCIACHGHGLSMGGATAERAVDFLLNGASLGVVDARRLD